MHEEHRLDLLKMSTTYATPAWVQGLKAKRPLDWINCLAYLLNAGLRNGQVTANDIPDTIRFAEANTIGACFKDLRRFGFRKTNTTVKAKAARKHGRDLPIWVLENPQIARQWVSELAHHVINTQPQTQLEML